MTNAECRKEVKRCIRFYERRGWDWTSAVGFITFRHLFGDDAMISRRWRGGGAYMKPVQPKRHTVANQGEG